MWQEQLALQPVRMMTIACLLMLIIHMIQEMHRSENQTYPLYFLCSSPVLPSFKHTWHCMADKVVMSTWQHFVTHDTVRFFANMLLSQSVLTFSCYKIALEKIIYLIHVTVMFL